MLISINFLHLRHHLDHLERELQIAEDIELVLQQQYQLALDNSGKQCDFYIQQLQFVQKMVSHIRCRKRVLEQTYETFYNAKIMMENRISQVKHRIDT